MWHAAGMNTLAEIESAVVSLPVCEKEELLRFLADRLRTEYEAPPPGWPAALGAITDETFVRPPQPRVDPVTRLR